VPAIKNKVLIQRRDDVNIVVCVKPVPDPEQYDKLRLDPVTKRLVREGIDSIVNPTDKNALEAGLALRDKFGGKVIVVAMCPDFNAPQIKECLAMGADEAYILSDRAFGGADTFATSYTLVQGFKKIGIEADIVLGGNESADGATSQMISQIGEWMELPHVSNIIEMEVEDGVAKVKKKTPNGYVAYEVELPAVIGIARGANKPRMVTAMGIIKSKNKPLTIYGKADLDVDEKYIGLPGSPTQPGSFIEPDMARAGVKIEGEPEEIAAKIIDVIKKSGYQL
jgi:electron transfer flavoprotein beta subunit